MTAVDRLENLCKSMPTLLHIISDDEFNYKQTPDKWSKKQILGHLIDSATNNHQRFIRSQFEYVPIISYDQNKWNVFNYYQQIKVGQLIIFWASYNLQLVALYKLIPSANLKNECNTGEQNNVTIEWLFNDYVSHLEHHLQKILEKR